MSTMSRGTLWRQSRRRARRLGRQGSLGVARILRRPFPRLVQHFLVRLVRGGDSVSSDFELGIGALLGLLATPGAFQCFLMLDKYSSLLNWMRGRLRQDLVIASAPDKFMFLAIAMAVTGIVTLLKWDRILPDSQDYLNLAPLPIPPRTVLLANSVAIAIAVLILAVDVNAVSMVLFPGFVTSAMRPASIAFGEFAVVHAWCVILASLFAFCSVFAVMGLAAAVLPRKIFRASSSWLRGLLLVAFAALLLTGLTGPELIARLRAAPDSAISWLPPLWYLSLYQSLQHRATPVFTMLASRAIWGLALAFGLAILAYAVSYRRRFAAILEGDGPASKQRLLGAALAFLDLFSDRQSGFRRASYRFAVRTLLRNETQRLCISVSLGLGWLLAFQAGSAAFSNGSGQADWLPPVSLLGAALIPAYLLILGLRLAFEIPAAISANWIFQSTVNSKEHESLRISRQLMLAFLVPAVLIPCVAFSWWYRGLNFAALHTAYVLALSLCLMEILLSGYRKIPFTSLMPGFRENLPLLCLLQILGFVAFTRFGADVERWMFHQPPRFLWVPIVMSAAWMWNQRRIRNAKQAGEVEIGLSYESSVSPVIVRLKLSDGE